MAKKNTDTVPAMLTPGEVVLNAKQQKRLGELVGMSAAEVFKKIGVPGFAKGGKVLKSSKKYQAGGIAPKLDISSGIEGDKKSYYAYKARNLRGGKEFINPDGRPSTVIMRDAEYDGRNYAFPTLFHDKKKGWYKKDDTDEAFDEAMKRDELFDFGKDSTSARKFAKGSWKPKNLQAGGIANTPIVGKQKIRRSPFLAQMRELVKMSKGGKVGSSKRSDIYRGIYLAKMRNR